MTFSFFPQNFTIFIKRANKNLNNHFLSKETHPKFAILEGLQLNDFGNILPE